MFVGRENELKHLDNEYKNNHSFVIIYGRRRCGKTTLIQKFIEDKDSMFFQATEDEDVVNISNFINTLYLSTNNPLLKNYKTNSWEDAFNIYLNTIDKSKKNILVIDEFSYIVSKNKAFPSLLQKIWDLYLSKENIMLILCGSLVPIMKKSALNYNSPLYGRRTSQIEINPLPFTDATKMMNTNNFKDQVRFYSITGGIPLYLNLIQNNDIEIFVKQTCLNTSGYLFIEPAILLNHSYNLNNSYLSVINAIGSGHTKPTDIASFLNKKTNEISPALHLLEEQLIIKKELPATENKKSRKGIYLINDKFLNFYFHFIKPFESQIERGLFDSAYKHFNDTFYFQFQGKVFESVCRELFITEIKNKKFEWNIDTLGSYFNRDHSIEIDVVSLDKINNKLFLGECKFFNKKTVDISTFNNLVEKSKIFKIEKITYGLFSVTGFTKEVLDLAKNNDNLLLFNEYSYIQKSEIHKAKNI